MWQLTAHGGGERQSQGWLPASETQWVNSLHGNTRPVLPTHRSARTEVRPQVCSVSHSQHCPCKVCFKSDSLGLLVLMASFVAVVQSLSCVQLFAAPWTAACQASLSFTTSWSLPKFIPTESVILSNHLVLCQPLLLLPSTFPRIRVSFYESVLHIRWPKY